VLIYCYVEQGEEDSSSEDEGGEWNRVYMAEAKRQAEANIENEKRRCA
jgi:hypothetical protein